MPHLSRGVEQPSHNGLSGAGLTRPKQRDAHGGAVVCREGPCHLQHLGVERERVAADLLHEILEIGVEIATAPRQLLVPGRFARTGLAMRRWSSAPGSSLAFENCIRIITSRVGSTRPGGSRLQQGSPDGLSQLLGRCLSVLQVHPDELQRLADHVDVGGDQASRWAGFCALRSQASRSDRGRPLGVLPGPAMRPNCSPPGVLWRHQQRRVSEAGECGAVCHGISSAGWCPIQWMLAPSSAVGTRSSPPAWGYHRGSPTCSRVVVLLPHHMAISPYWYRVVDRRAFYYAHHTHMPAFPMSRKKSTARPSSRGVGIGSAHLHCVNHRLTKREQPSLVPVGTFSLDGRIRPTWSARLSGALSLWALTSLPRTSG